jgi:hypothetical protein
MRPSMTRLMLWAIVVLMAARAAYLLVEVRAGVWPWG